MKGGLYMALPGQKPLNFISSIPKNKSTNVSTSLKTITLLFDKNVVDDSVWDNNRKQIKMWAGPFRISVRISRSKLFSERRKIFVTPIKGLSPNVKYTIAIYPDLKSKAGQELGETVIVSFTTAKTKTTTTPVRIPEE